MSTIHSACLRARENLRHGIVTDRRFPRNVFSGQWDDFFFFDSDWIFDADFVQWVKDLINLEDGHCACLANLDAFTDAGSQERLLFIDHKSTSDEYRSLLCGETPGDGWIHTIDRFSCTSDAFQWCIYCERSNEIAVIAIRKYSSLESYLPLMAKYKAARLDEAIRKPISYGFSAQALSTQWRSEFLKEYVARSP